MAKKKKKVSASRYYETLSQLRETEEALAEYKEKFNKAILIAERSIELAQQRDKKY